MEDQKKDYFEWEGSIKGKYEYILHISEDDLETLAPYLWKIFSRVVRPFSNDIKHLLI